MIKTRFTDMFDVEYPLMQGGLQWISTAELVSSVANAGALGVLTALTQSSPEHLSNEIKRTRELTDRPFGVNLTFLPSMRSVPYDEYCAAIVECGIKIVETAGARPDEYIPTLKRSGVKIIHKCTSVRHAIAAERMGVDVVSIDGFECAGHPGEDDVGGLVLIPAACARLKIPVIASGGICDARGIVAALSLGAEGVNMGTRFCATTEAPIHEDIKRLIVENDECMTNLILRQFRNTGRVIKTDLSDSVVDMLRDSSCKFEDIAQLVKGENCRNALMSGDSRLGIIWGGQSQGLIHDIPSVLDLVPQMFIEAQSLVRGRLTSIFAADK